MIKITIVLLFSILMLVLHFKFKNDGVFSPRAAYYLAFIPTVFLLYFYIDKWKIDLSFYTVTVIIIGILLFAGVSIVVEVLNFRREEKRIKIKGVNLEKQIGDVQIWKYMVFIGFQLFTIVLFRRYIISLVGFGDTYAVANNIRQLSVAEYVDIPSWLNILRSMCLASGYIWIYLFEKKMFVDKNKKITEILLLLINFLLSAYLSSMMGGRGNLVDYIVVAWIMFYSLCDLSSNPKKYRRISYIIAGATFILTILFFQVYGIILGRELSYDNLEYFMVYFSAPIKNLDTFLDLYGKEIGIFSGRISGLSENYTIYPLLNFIALQFGLSWLYYDRSLVDFYYPNRRINGYYLGNCYTVFAPYLSDGGWIGLIVYTAFHAWSVQKVYNSVKKNMSVQVRNGIYLTLIIYCKFWYCTFFSFFTDMFYYNVITIGFLRSCIYMLIIKFFLYNFDISILKSRKC